MKKLQLSTNISLYLGNDTRYCQARQLYTFEWYQFQWPSVTSNPDFKVMILFNVKWYKIELYLQWPINRKSYIQSIERCYFQRPWTTPNPSFKVKPLFTAECLRNSVRYRHSCNERLTSFSKVSFRMTFGDLGKYSMTWSIARSLCNSWASCCIPYCYNYRLQILLLIWSIQMIYCVVSVVSAFVNLRNNFLLLPATLAYFLMPKTVLKAATTFYKKKITQVIT